MSETNGQHSPETNTSIESITADSSEVAVGGIGKVLPWIRQKRAERIDHKIESIEDKLHTVDLEERVIPAKADEILSNPVTQGDTGLQPATKRGKAATTNIERTYRGRMRKATAVYETHRLYDVDPGVKVELPDPQPNYLKKNVGARTQVDEFVRRQEAAAAEAAEESGEEYSPSNQVQGAPQSLPELIPVESAEGRKYYEDREHSGTQTHKKRGLKKALKIVAKKSKALENTEQYISIYARGEDPVSLDIKRQKERLVKKKSKLAAKRSKLR